MLRGAIDLIRPDRIGGWIYSAFGEVSENKVLAYLDDTCVGSGEIDILRDDLKNAGLGNGMLGFSFAISLDDPADLPRVVIKLDGSDLALLQPRATVARTESFQPITANLERVEWMRQKGMLAPAEISFLKYLQQLSVFDYSLIQPRAAAQAKADAADPRAAAQGQFDLLTLRRSQLKETELVVSEREELVSAVLSGSGQPTAIVAIHAAEASTVAVVEGSHVDATEEAVYDGA